MCKTNKRDSVLHYTDIFSEVFNYGKTLNLETIKYILCLCYGLNPRLCLRCDSGILYKVR